MTALKDQGMNFVLFFMEKTPCRKALPELFLFAGQDGSVRGLSLSISLTRELQGRPQLHEQLLPDTFSLAPPSRICRFESWGLIFC